MNLQDGDGDTALHNAVHVDDRVRGAEIMAELLMLGADPEIKNNAGLSAEKRATKEGKPDAAAIFRGVAASRFVGRQDLMAYKGLVLILGSMITIPMVWSM